MLHVFKVFSAAMLMGTFATVAQATNVSDVFNGEMLGTTQRYFESVAGIPRESFGDTHIFRVQGCDIAATISNDHVSALNMELSDACPVDLSTFIGDYAPESGPNLTIGAFAQAAGGGLNYLADCLASCGNAYDPSVYAHWEGPRAADFIEVMLEVALIDDAAIDAANAWEDHMVQAAGEDYVFQTRFNCDRSFDAVAAQAFKDVEVTGVTIGHGLNTPGC